VNAATADRASRIWLLRSLIRRELLDRFAGTSIGLGWVLLQPLVMLAIYSFVFAWVLQVRLPGSDSTSAFVIHLALVLWPWTFFQEGLTRGMGAFRAQASLVRKTRLPRELPILAAVSVSGIVHGSGYLLVLVCLFLMGAAFSLSGLPLFLLLLLILLLMTAALALVLSVLQLIWRDLDQALGPLLMVLFYLSPILYPLELVPADWRDVAAMNPVAWWAGRLRDALLTGAVPGLIDMLALLAVVVLFLLARRLFLRVAGHAEDLL